MNIEDKTSLTMQKSTLSFRIHKRTLLTQRSTAHPKSFGNLQSLSKSSNFYPGLHLSVHHSSEVELIDQNTWSLQLIQRLYHQTLATDILSTTDIQLKNVNPSKTDLAKQCKHQQFHSASTVRRKTLLTQASIPTTPPTHPNMSPSKDLGDTRT